MASFFISEVVLILLLLGPLRKIKRLAMIYQDFPNGNYQKAIALDKNSPAFFKDEISELETHAFKLAKELKNMDSEVELSKKQLIDKVTLLTSSQDYLQRLFEQSNLCIALLKPDLSISSNNRYLTELLEINASHKSFLELLCKDEEKQKVQTALLDFEAGKINEVQILTAVWARNNKTLKVFWSFSSTMDSQGESKVLAMGMPILTTDTAQLFTEQSSINKNLTQARLEFNSPDFINQNKEQTMQCLVRSIADKNIQLLFEPRFAVNHLVINDYQVRLKFNDLDCQLLSYNSVRTYFAEAIDIVCLDEHILKLTYEFIKQQQPAHHDLKVCLAIAAQTLISGRFISLVEKMNQIPELVIPAVHFEIDYSATWCSQVAFKNNLLKLHELGHEVTLRILNEKIEYWDELDSIAVDFLKISDNLLEKLKLSGDFQNRLLKLINAAHNNDRPVVIEGVNSEHDYLALKQAGADWVQGALIKEPQPALINSLDIVAIQALLKNL